MRFPALYISTGLLCMITAVSCKKLIEIDPPKNTIGTHQVFQNETQAEGAMAGLYTRMINADDVTQQFAAARSKFSAGAATIIAGLSADEFIPYSGPADPENYFLYTNKLTILRDGITLPVWESAYKTIYNANAIIEGIAASTSSALPLNTRRELTGEAKFVRALCYFYLTNLFGEVPLTLTIDFNKTVRLPRAPQNEVYRQMVEDLKEAAASLSEGYKRGKGERIRPNKWAATALLARVYLYMNDYPAAAAAASAVISQQELYALETDLNNVFLAISKEAIWQLKQTSMGSIMSATPEGYALISGEPKHQSSTQFILTTQLLQAFESNDKRRTDWVDSTDNTSPSNPPNITWYPAKYKIGPSTLYDGLPAEYYTVLRLAEMYLIRAEAAAYGALGGPSDGVNDLNEIRKRAGLTNLSSSLTKDQLLEAIEHERQVELFSEWGHRWLDLKRTGRAHDVLSVIPAKQPWAGDHQFLYPIPSTERRDNPQLSQNDGY